MSFGQNLQLLRKQRGITQEQLAETMSVSRQTVSKWESDEAMPEIRKLIDLCDLFSCKMDALVREDMAAQEDAYSSVSTRLVNAFRMARYVMITPNPEDDVSAYMEQWAQKAGLTQGGREIVKIGWDFPFVTSEQENRCKLRGYVMAYILPDGFETSCPGVEIACQEEAVYAVITVRDPFAAPFELIPGAYKRVLEYLKANGFKECQKANVLQCFERVYDKDGVTYMDVYLHADGVAKANVFTPFR